ncbi:MAG: efflux RND transporter permease subunit [Spirochaetaceae bacterium]|nr:MAG: efflux RND transporter permease subunit [Spirochaetaceae bacterium]
MAVLVLLAVASFGAVLGPYNFNGEQKLTVLVEHPGIEAGEIERSITLVIENAAAGLEGVTEMLSHSRDGSAQVELRYRPDHDLETAYLQLRDLAEGVAGGLPSGSRTPQILRAGGSEMRSPVFIVAFPNPADAGALADGALAITDLNNDELRSRYAAIEQVAIVEVAGREPEEILIRYRTSELSNNEMFGAAAMTQVLRDFSRSLAVDLGSGNSLVVGQRYDSGTAVDRTPLGDIHTIGRLTSVIAQPRRAERVTQLNGSRGALVYVMSTADADLIRLSKELRALGEALLKEQRLRADSPESVPEPLVLYDLGEELRLTLYALVAQVLIGAGAVVVLLAVFLRAGRNTWVVIPAVGFACLTPVALLSVLDIALDATVLGAVALAAGLAADGSAVVLEFELRKAKGAQQRPYTTALFFSFLSTVVVFLPLYYAEPAFRTAYGPFALALCSGLAAATLYTTWIMPETVRGASTARIATARLPSFSRALLGLEGHVRRHRPLVFALSGLVLVVAGARVLSLEYRTEERVDVGASTAIVEFAAGTTVEAVVSRSAEYEARVVPGRDAGFQVLTRSEAGRLRMDFIGVDDTAAAQLKAALESETREGETLYFPGELNSHAGFEIRVTGPERTQLHDIIRRVAGRLSLEPETEALYFRFREAAPVIEIEPLPPAMRAAGLESRELASQIHHALGTGIAGKWYNHAGERDIRIQAAAVPASIQELRNFPISTPTGGVVDIGSVAEIRAVTGVDTMRRRNRLPTLSLTVLGNDFRAPQLREMLGGVPRGAGYFIDVEPVSAESKAPIAMAGAAVALVFLVVLMACNRPGAAAWASAPAPVCLLLSLGVLSLTRGGGSIGLQSLLAVVLGLGISVNFSLLYLLTLLARSFKVPLSATELLDVKSHVYRACIPATLTTVVGVIPAMLGLGGSDMLRSLSIGICVSAVVSLLILPVWAGLFDPGMHTRRTW